MYALTHTFPNGDLFIGEIGAIELDDLHLHEETLGHVIDAISEQLKNCLLYTSPSPRDRG